jgi:hypothetical protein
MSHLCCQRHKQNISASVISGAGEGPLSSLCSRGNGGKSTPPAGWWFVQNTEGKANWTWAVIYVWHFIILSFWPSCICECWTALRATVACPLQRYWLFNLFTCPTVTAIHFVGGSGRNWPAGLATVGCLVVRLRLWQPWHPVKNGTELILLDSLPSPLSVSIVNSYTVLGYSKLHLLLCPLTLHQHTGTWNVALEVTICLCNKVLWI